MRHFDTRTMVEEEDDSVYSVLADKFGGHFQIRMGRQEEA